jgi:hypothetical protein
MQVKNIHKQGVPAVTVGGQRLHIEDVLSVAQAGASVGPYADV